MKKETVFPQLKPAYLAALLPTCVALNFAGSLIRDMLKVPLFLDTGGTLLATFIGGPVVGLCAAALHAVVMMIVYGPIQIWTILPTGIIALIVGFSAKKGWTKSWLGLILTLIAEQPFACVASAYVYTYIYGGFSGGGLDIMHAVFMEATSSVFASSFISELVSGFLDKAVLTVVLMLIFRALPAKFRVATPFAGASEEDDD